MFTDVKTIQDATSEDAQLFINCAGAGYRAGMEAMLEHGIHFSHSDWIDALDYAAHGKHAMIVRFILQQLVAQVSDIIPDNEWFEAIEKRSPALAVEIQTCEFYVRACRVREKLNFRAIVAQQVDRPDFLEEDSKTKVYAFCKDRQSDIVGDHAKKRQHKMTQTAIDSEAARRSGQSWESTTGDFSPSADTFAPIEALGGDAVSART